MKLVFIGGGNMAEAILKGLISAQRLTPEEIQVVDIVPERLETLQSNYGVRVSSDLAVAASGAENLVLAVKPQGMPEVLQALAPHLASEALVISIAAGISCASIERALASGQRVVRVMPNTPALVGKGAAAVSLGTSATEGDAEQVMGWMQAVGLAVHVEESAMDAVTALSGSGPAYGFYLLEGMLQAAEQMGLQPEQARLLAAATLEGAAVMVKEGTDAPGVLRERVTSKGGTTAAALKVLEEQGVKSAIVQALEAACARSKELSAEG